MLPYLISISVIIVIIMKLVILILITNYIRIVINSINATSLLEEDIVHVRLMLKMHFYLHFLLRNTIGSDFP